MLLRLGACIIISQNSGEIAPLCGEVGGKDFPHGCTIRLLHGTEGEASMDLLPVIVTALAFAGGEAAKTVVSEPVKDAYRSIKEFLSRKYPQVDLTQVEKAPQSKPRQDVLVEDLTNSGVVADVEFLPLARGLVDTVAAEMRKTGRDTGVHLREFEAASLRIKDVIASGAGVVAQNTKIAGHAEISGIRAGTSEDRNPKNR
jgi:hypothetical protein